MHLPSLNVYQCLPRFAKNLPFFLYAAFLLLFLFHLFSKESEEIHNVEVAT